MKLKPRKIRYLVHYELEGGIKGDQIIYVNRMVYPRVNEPMLTEIRKFIAGLEMNRHKPVCNVVIANIVRLA